MVISPQKYRFDVKIYEIFAGVNIIKSSAANYSMIETRYTELKDGRMAYIDHGDGPVVLLLHGLPTSKELFLPTLPYLSSNFRYIIPDLLQYGQSDQPSRHFTHKDRAVHLKQLLAELKIGKFILVAHDLGASIAVDFMDKFSKMVKKLVLISPPVYPDFKIPFLVKISRAPIIGILSIFFMRGLLFKIGLRKGMVNKKNYDDSLHGSLSGPFRDRHGRATLYRILNWGSPSVDFADYPGIIKAIEVPTLIIHGRKDPYIPLEHSQRLKGDIENSRLNIIDDGSHFLPADTPEQLAELLKSFIVEE